MVGIPQIKARNARLSNLVGAEVNPCDVFAKLALGQDAGIDPVRAAAEALIFAGNNRPLFDMRNAAAALCLLNQTEHAPQHGGWTAKFC